MSNTFLVRHGQSEWNEKKLFTGWVDVALSTLGEKEIEHAARVLLERGYTVDICYTSLLKRAIHSSWILLKELNQVYRPMIKSWRLNERMYGALEGIHKPTLAKQFGEKKVQEWRAGLVDRPPEMDINHPFYHSNELKYKSQYDTDAPEIPRTESLQDCIDRTIPLLENSILPDLAMGRNVMIVAHRNSIRGIVKHIDNIGTLDIEKIGIPNGIPLVYKFDENLNPIRHQNAVQPLSGIYLEKPGLLRKVLDKEKELAQRVVGYNDDQTNIKKTAYHAQPELSAPEETIPVPIPITASTSAKSTTNDSHSKHLSSLLELERIKELALIVEKERRMTVHEQPLVFKTEESIQKNNCHEESEESDDDLSKISSPIIVIMRHGKTEHNKLGLFTGWEDVNLALEGRQEAINAGKLLQQHGIFFDVVYTSWLSRAIETAWLVLQGIDTVWVPVVKTWRLNERMYGSLTSLSKKMIRQKFGDEQFMKWRRGFDTPPPPVSSFSHAYPGNDERYVTYATDLPISIFETFIRSLAHGKLEIHRDFPKYESLKDCMERTIPYFNDVILPESIESSKNLLILSSENSIRCLLMQLCEIPKEEIHNVEIPTGLPLVYDCEKKSIRLLEDPSLTQPLLSHYNFGSSPELLFKKGKHMIKLNVNNKLKVDQ